MNTPLTSALVDKLADPLTYEMIDLTYTAVAQARAELQYGPCQDEVCECTFRDEADPNYGIYWNAYQEGLEALEVCDTWEEISLRMLEAAFVHTATLEQDRSRAEAVKAALAAQTAST